jgi:hypothetical protein
MPRKRFIVERDLSASDGAGGKSPPPVADASDVQELRVRLIRANCYGDAEARQMVALERWVVTEPIPLDDFDAEVQRRFGPWPKAQRDRKGRVMWTPRDANALGPGIRGLVVASDHAVVVRGGENVASG